METKEKSIGSLARCFQRRRWDLNPRAGKTDNLISSQARYDHFDTSPEYEIVIKNVEKVWKK